MSTTRWCSPPGPGPCVPPLRRPRRGPTCTCSVPSTTAGRSPPRVAGARPAVVLGGGLLGLEAARGLAGRGLDVTVVHSGPAPDGAPARPGRRPRCSPRTLAGLGVRVACGRRRHASGPAAACASADGTELPADLLVVACGVRPDTALAARGRARRRSRHRRRRRDAHQRSGRLRDRRLRRASTAPCYGLVAPAWEQAATVADRLTGGATRVPRFAGGDPAQGQRHRPGGDGIAARRRRRRGGELRRPEPGARTPGWSSATTGSPARCCSATTRRSARSFSSSTATPRCPPTGARCCSAARSAPTRGRGRLPGAHAGRRPWSAGATRCARRPSPRAGGPVAGPSTTSSRRPGPRTGCGSCRDAVCGLVDWLSTADSSRRRWRHETRRRRQRHGRAAVRRGAGRARHRTAVVGHRAGRGESAGVRPGAAVGLLRRRDAPRSSRSPHPAYRPAWTFGSANRPLAIDRTARVVRTRAGEYPYDALVLATGSRPFVPPVPGADSPRLLRLPHARRPGGAARVRRRAAPRGRSSAAVCSAWRRPTRCACWVCGPPSWSSRRT